MWEGLETFVRISLAVAWRAIFVFIISLTNTNVLLFKIILYLWNLLIRWSVGNSSVRNKKCVRLLNQSSLSIRLFLLQYTVNIILQRYYSKLCFRRSRSNPIILLNSNIHTTNTVIKCVLIYILRYSTQKFKHLELKMFNQRLKSLA